MSPHFGWPLQVRLLASAVAASRLQFWLVTLVLIVTRFVPLSSRPVAALCSFQFLSPSPQRCCGSFRSLSFQLVCYIASYRLRLSLAACTPVSLAPLAHCHFPPTPRCISRCCAIRMSAALRLLRSSSFPAHFLSALSRSMHSVSLAPVARCHFPPTPGFIGQCCPVRISKAIRSHTARRESSASVALKFTFFGAFCRLCARVREYHIRRSAAATCLPSLSFSSIDLLTPAAAHLITRRHLRPSPQWFCDLHLQQVSAALVVFRFRVRVRRAARLRLAVRGRRSAVSSPPPLSL